MKPSLHAYLVLAGLALPGAPGCYNPVIENGGLLCSEDEQKCPAGYECMSDGRCWKQGTSPGGGGTGGGTGGIGGGGEMGGMGGGTGGMGGGGEMGGMGGGGMGGGGAAECKPMIMTDQPCDPVCQLGCDDEKICAVPVGVAECVSSVGTRGIDEACVRDGGPADCAPGLLCIRDFCGDSCYRFCRDATHCGEQRHCTRVLLYNGVNTGYGLCDVEINGCDPIGTRAVESCDSLGKGYGCYVIEVDETGCACTGASPPLEEGAACIESRECQPGLMCANGACSRVCKIGGADPICGMKKCVSWKRSKKFGYCQ